MQTGEVIVAALITIAVSYTICYFVIKAAVSSANREMLEQLKALNTLKIMEMKKQGYEIEALRRLGGYYHQIKQIEKRKQFITIDEYNMEVMRLNEIFN